MTLEAELIGVCTLAIVVPVVMNYPFMNVCFAIGYFCNWIIEPVFYPFIRPFTIHQLKCMGNEGADENISIIILSGISIRLLLGFVKWLKQNNVINTFTIIRE